MPKSYWVDGIIIGILLLSMITGLFRGFVKECVALGIWIVAIWFAIHYFRDVANWLQHYIQDSSICAILAVILIIVTTVLSGSIINMILSFILHSSGLTGTDRLLGMGFGLIRGIFIVSLLILAVSMTSFIPYEQYTQQSLLYARFNPIVNWLSTYTPNVINQIKQLDDPGQR